MFRCIPVYQGAKHTLGTGALLFGKEVPNPEKTKPNF